MKWQLMTDGDHIKVVSKVNLDQFSGNGFVKVGPTFNDRYHANEHAKKIANIMKGA